MEKLTRNEAFSLSVDAYYKKSSVDSKKPEERYEGFINYLADLGKDFRRNKIDIFEIIEDTVNDVLPKKVLETVKQFAEFKSFDDNVTVKFKVKNGKIKAVAVALGGTVTRHRIDKGWFTVKTEALQAKVYEEYERVLGGQVDWAELINMVVDAINEEIMERIYSALIGIYTSLPTANKASGTTLDKAEFDRVIATIKAYGSPVIMGTSLAVSKITLDSTNASEADKMDMRNKGFLGIYKGCPVVELPQSFEDESNTVKVFDDSYIFIIPAGQDKVVKVALEGGLKTKDSTGEDWTFNFEAYQKAGVSVLAVNNIGIYKFV